MMITVLLADDHSIVRDVLRRLLETAGDIQIVATASNGKEAVAQAVLHCPAVAVIDVSMPLMDGIEATRQICIDCPQTRVLMVSGHHSPYYIQRCLQAGALGYVLKDVAGAELVIAVRSTQQGNRFFSKQIAEIAKRFIQ
jgi:DNA-binding NarL/FixJ family response regulator